MHISGIAGVTSPECFLFAFYSKRGEKSADSNLFIYYAFFERASTG